MVKPYHQLTNRGQAFRLRKMAAQALEQYDITITRLRLVTNFYNCIFRADSTTGEKYILRIALPDNNHRSARFVTEMSWLEALYRDTGLSIPRPVSTRDGRWTVKATVKGVPDARYCMLIGWVPGGDLANHISERTLTKWGQLSAILHNHAKSFIPPVENGLPIFNRIAPPQPFKKPLILFNTQYKNLFPWERRQVYQGAIENAQEALENIQASGEPQIIVHGELHPWNIRLYRGVLSPIDFEDLIWSWPVQDIATSLYYLVSHENYPELKAAFLEGYTSIRPWPERYPGELNAFIASRGIGMINLILQHPNPDWRAQAAEYVKRVEGRFRRIIDLSR